jgi:DNA polymerase III epsilon subunit-like protein
MILFFDTETTGLPKNWKAPVTDLDNWPRLVQLAYLVYDFDGNLIHSCNEIVKPNGFTIPTEASNVHGITTEMARQRGSDINDVFELFLIHLKRSKMIVAHNMAFDEKIIGSELIRLGKENVIVAKEKICTMLKTVDLCKIEGPYGYKWPKLEELHRYLFNHDFEGAHDALADIQATAKCFWELVSIGVLKNIAANKSSYIEVPKSLFGNLQKILKLDQNKNFDVPFLIIDEKGKESWTLYNTKLDIKHKMIEYQDISDVMKSRLSMDENLWNNYHSTVSFFQKTHDTENNIKNVCSEKWMGWKIIDEGQLFYNAELILKIPNLFSISEKFTNQFIKGFKIFKTENNISKILAHYRRSHFSGLLGDGEETVFEEYYFTLFYIDQNGSVFLENNQLEFDPDSCVPFLKIDADGKSSWQFYNYKKDVFFGRIFEEQVYVEREINSVLFHESTFLWQEDYYGKPGLNVWHEWLIDDNGNLSYAGNVILNVFQLNLGISSYYIGKPLLMNFNFYISKIILYHYDADHEGPIFDGYTTLFYINDKGIIFLENNYSPPELVI